MSVLTVGSGEQYSTVAAATNAARDGDTIDVAAGTYVNDWVTDSDRSLTFNAVGGAVVMQATAQPPNGKAILTEGGAGVTVTIDGFVFEGATVPDGNGAGIRYEGGTLHITNSAFFGNEDGILGGADPNGVITIDRSEFGGNGINGSGYTHNLYIGDIASFSLTNSYSHDANIGHEVKSRAESNTITGNVILDNNSTASYEIDLPNGGNAVIAGNTIEQGPDSQNPNIIAYGEEGNLHAGTSLSVVGNTIVNDLGSGPALWNATAAVASFADNDVYGFGAVAVYRFFDAVDGTHFFTDSAAERDSLVATRPDMTYEGAGLSALASAGSDGAAEAVYRFFDTADGTHFYTQSASERDSLVAGQPGMILEGVAFYEDSAPAAGDAPVYRFFDTIHGTHLYTESAAERAAIVATRPDLVAEGVAFYAPT